MHGLKIFVPYLSSFLYIYIRARKNIPCFLLTGTGARCKVLVYTLTFLIHIGVPTYHVVFIFLHAGLSSRCAGN